MSKITSPEDLSIKLARIDKIVDLPHPLGPTIETISPLFIEKFISFADVPTSRKLVYLTKDKASSDAFTKENIEKRNKANAGFYATYEEMNKREWKHRKDLPLFQTELNNKISFIFQ